MLGYWEYRFAAQSNGRFSPLEGLRREKSSSALLAPGVGDPGVRELVVIRKFVTRLLIKGGLHPDMTLPPLVKSSEAPLTLLPIISAKNAAADIHPDLDWDVAPVELQVVAAQEADLDVLGLAVSLEELLQEEDAAAEIPGDPDFSALPSADQHTDIDWSFELAWAGASGETGVTEAADSGWEAFDFDVADLGPDPEALAEETIPSVETAMARERRLDGAAADLVLSLGAFRSADRRALYRRFRTVVEDFQHAASHAALHRLLAEGASLEEIEEAAQLRCLWRDQPWLWAQKRSERSAWSVRRSSSQRLAFGWPTAVRLVRTFGLVKAERAMSEDWFDAWTGLERAKAVSPVEEMAFFTYAGFLRQLTPLILMESQEGVFEEASDGPERLELRDYRGSVIWQFERKLAPRAGEFSFEPARVRNHAAFVEAAADNRFGLPELVALSPVESIATGFSRNYNFLEKTFDGTEGSRVKISSLSCHGLAKIVTLDLKACQITLAVTHDQKRLLKMHVALISDPPAARPAVNEEKPAKRRGKDKKKDINE